MSTTALMTFADFEKLPEKPGKQELLDGELIELPPPKATHSLTAANLYRVLFQATRGEARLIFDAGYRINSGWLMPDLSIMWPDQRREDDYFLRAPQLAIEIVSPSNTADQIDRKTRAYLNDGGQEVWVIYPKTRSMTLYSRTPDGKMQAHVVEGKYHSTLLNAEIDLDAIIPRPE